MRSLRCTLALALALSLTACADDTEPSSGTGDTTDFDAAGADATGDDPGADASGEDGGGEDTGTLDTTIDVAPACGDGAVNGDELCDDSAPVTGCSAGDVCSDDCSACVPTAPACGDGDINGTEICDGSARVTGCSPGDTCNDDCSACEAGGEAACGDGAVNGDEVCDGTADDDGCDGDETCDRTCGACVLEEVPACGDGAVNGDEICDGSDTADTGCDAPDVCADDCRACEAPAAGPRCGDGNVNGDETCDGSVRIGDDGCDAPEVCADDCGACEPPPGFCGDSVVGDDEVCDPSAPTDGCPATELCADDCGSCIPAPETCGDDVVDIGEVCDGERGCAAGTACADDCQTCLPIGCGDGAVSGDEVCDPSAEDNGCDVEGAVCSSDCSACSVCGDFEIGGSEECDHNGLGGEFGSCDAELEVCAPTCRCVPLALEILDASALSNAFLGTFSADVTIRDELGFESFLLVIADADGDIIDFYQQGSDLLLDSRFVPNRDVEEYEWRFTVHFLVPPSPDTAAVVGLVLLAEDGTPSNLVTWDAEVLFVSGGEGDPCDPEALLPRCAAGFDCDPLTAECTEFDDGFDLGSFAAGAAGAAGVEFSVELEDGTGDFLGYWLLAVETADEILVAFRGFDEDPVDVSGGVYAGTLTLPDFEENFGVALEDVVSFQGVFYDRTDVVVSDAIAAP